MKSNSYIGYSFFVIGRIRNLSTIPRDLEDIVSNRNLTSLQKTQLHAISERCIQPLIELNAELAKYHDQVLVVDKSSRQRSWNRLRWALRDDLRSKIQREMVLSCQSLLLFNQELLKYCFPPYSMYPVQTVGM